MTSHVTHTTTNKTAHIDIRIAPVGPERRWRFAGHFQGVDVSDVRQILTGLTRRFASGRKHGYQQTQAAREFIHTDADGTIWTDIGLIPRVAQYLTGQGWSVNVNDPHGFLSPDPVRGQILYQNDTQAIAWLHSREQQLADNKSLHIVTRNRKDAKRLERLLRKKSTRFVTSVPDHAWNTRARTVIVTTSLFSAVNPPDWDVVVYWGTEPVFSKDGQLGSEKCLNGSGQRLYPPHLFCLHRGESLSPTEQLILEQAFGPVILGSAPPETRGTGCTSGGHGLSRTSQTGTRGQGVRTGA